MRLTWRRADGAACPRVEKGTDIYYIAVEFTQKVYDKLAAYEDAEEQGLLVRLPCKVGDTVYCIRKNPFAKGRYVKENIAEAITVYRDHSFSIFSTLNDVLGQTVFLTREEAEATIKKYES